MWICSTVTPEEWEEFSNKNVLKAEHEWNSAVTLESMIEEILQEAHDDQQNQCDNVNLAFEKRIEETEKAKQKLEDHLSKVSITKTHNLFQTYLNRNSLHKWDMPVIVFLISFSFF